MGTSTLHSLGDFTSVHGFVQSLSVKDFAYNNANTNNREAVTVPLDQSAPQTPKIGGPLGDFSKLWEYLGTPSVPESITNHDTQLPLDAYASDGATFFRSVKKTAKTVKWEDAGHFEDERLDFDNISDGSASAPTADNKLTKTQRKRLNRQQRKAQTAAGVGKAAVFSESEAEIAPKVTTKKVGTHYLYGKHKPISVVKNKQSITESSLTDPERDVTIVVSTPARRAGAHVLQPVKNEPRTLVDDKSFSSALEAARNALQKEKNALSARSPPKQSAKLQATPTKVNTSLLPAIVTPRPSLPKSSYSSPSTNNESPLRYKSTNTADSIPKPTTTKPTIKPLIVRSLIDRYYGLIRRLDEDFPEDKQYLAAFSDTTMKFDPDGIHVFVDDSNIFIGFVEKLKENRNIPQKLFVEEPTLSFDAFALLLERRRPVAKRVLGGSKPEMPAHGKARQIGYECFLLDKVFKERELTERQIFFMERDRGLRSYGDRPPPPNTVFSEKNGGNVFKQEMTPKRYGPARLVEQCVDELLHLKMADSMLDVAKPSTMVVATGDAASAEYSGGFMAQIERALVRGWSVELVSWSKNISSMYKRRDWTQKWAGRFRIIYLDDYVEELLDM